MKFIVAALLWANTLTTIPAYSQECQKLEKGRVFDLVNTTAKNIKGDVSSSIRGCKRTSNHHYLNKQGGDYYFPIGSVSKSFLSTLMVSIITSLLEVLEDFLP